MKPITSHRSPSLTRTEKQEKNQRNLNNKIRPDTKCWKMFLVKEARLVRRWEHDSSLTPTLLVKSHEKSTRANEATKKIDEKIWKVNIKQRNYVGYFPSSRLPWPGENLLHFTSPEIFFKDSKGQLWKSLHVLAKDSFCSSSRAWISCGVLKGNKKYRKKCFAKIRVQCSFKDRVTRKKINKQKRGKDKKSTWITRL